ncbi:unnamed protein product [Prorocentrum cordatum]|uniref:Protein kinase domain-containing protein n=1 Tax=Prorocentrum cordatum TaxID=2364126 RepID=A0ABN9UC08_9DINO|nr:unnamed protein product [Polarella glacialis]
MGVGLGAGLGRLSIPLSTPKLKPEGLVHYPMARRPRYLHGGWRGVVKRMIRMMSGNADGEPPDIDRGREQAGGQQAPGPTMTLSQPTVRELCSELQGLVRQSAGGEPLSGQRLDRARRVSEQLCTAAAQLEEWRRHRREILDAVAASLAEPSFLRVAVEVFRRYVFPAVLLLLARPMSAWAEAPEAFERTMLMLGHLVHDPGLAGPVAAFLQQAPPPYRFVAEPAQAGGAPAWRCRLACEAALRLLLARPAQLRGLWDWAGLASLLGHEDLVVRRLACAALSHMVGLGVVASGAALGFLELPDLGLRPPAAGPESWRAGCERDGSCSSGAPATDAVSWTEGHVQAIHGICFSVPAARAERSLFVSTAPDVADTMRALLLAVGVGRPILGRRGRRWQDGVPAEGLGAPRPAAAGLPLLRRADRPQDAVRHLRLRRDGGRVRLEAGDHHGGPESGAVARPGGRGSGPGGGAGGSLAPGGLEPPHRIPDRNQRVDVHQGFRLFATFSTGEEPPASCGGQRAADGAEAPAGEDEADAPMQVDDGPPLEAEEEGAGRAAGPRRRAPALVAAFTRVRFHRLGAAHLDAILAGLYPGHVADGHLSEGAELHTQTTAPGRDGPVGPELRGSEKILQREGTKMKGFIKRPNCQSHFSHMMATLSAIQSVVEAYVSSVAPTTLAFGFLTLVPWSSQEKPANVLASGAGGEVNLASIAHIVEQHEVVLIVSVYRTEREKRGVSGLLNYLRTAHPDAIVFLVQLPDRLDTELTKAYISELMARQDELYSFGADGVLMELAGDPEGLQHRLSLELQENAAIQLRVQAFADNANQGVPSARDVKIIEDEFRGLLWNAIPNMLMPGFAPLDKLLLEDGNGVGDFRFVRSYSDHHHVLLAVKGQHEKVVIKVHDKSSVTDAKKVESIHQEFCLLTHILDHPHIIRCVGMLQSQCNVYVALQYGGDVSMEQVLSTQGEHRLSRDDALICSAQVASALSYCHAKDVVHGQVSLRHVAVEMACNRHICRLVDFSMAAHVPNSSTRKTLCGSLPCVAPETVLDEPYLPKPADCWSVGVLFLETACGQGSLEKSVQWRRGESLAHAAWKILEFFSKAGCHTEAMTKMGNALDGTTLACLGVVLKPEPARRATASDVVEMFSAAHTEETGSD